jgi:hypothetical protein
MLTNPRTSHGADNNVRYLIRDTCYPGAPENPCARPPKEREAEFGEVLADFQRQKSMSRKLEWKFEVPNPLFY